MPSITLKCPYGQNEMVMSPTEMLEAYFYGIDICDSLPDETLKFYLDSAQQEVEKSLDLKIIPQIISESQDFWRNDWRAWGFVRMTYPVKKVNKLKGFINDVQQIDYPQEWVSERITNDGYLFFRNIYLIPTNGVATTNAAIFSGITPHLGFFGHSHIPHYWRAQYCTGFDSVPKDLLNFIGRLAAINVFHVLGDIILGAGIANQSISIDGLSQSIGTTSSAENSGYSGRIRGYITDMKRQWPLLKANYKSVTMTSL